MANNNLQAQEIESLNMKEAFFMKNKKAIIIALVLHEEGFLHVEALDFLSL